MSVTLKVTPELRQFTGDNESIELDGTTVNEALDSLKDTYPECTKWFFNEAGALTVWIIINKEIVMGKDFDKPLPENTCLTVTRIYGGG